MDRLVVIGGDAAGMSAASQARRLRSASDLSIVAFERSSYVSYSACGEPFFVGGEIDELETLIERTPERHAMRDIEVRIHHEVVDIDTARREVTVRDLDAGRGFVEPYDELMYATGARARRPIEGSDLRGVFELRTLDDAEAIRTFALEGARNAVVVGGGYIGLEMAEAFQNLGLDTALISAGHGVLERQLDIDLAARAAEMLNEAGLHIDTGHRIERLDGEDGRVVAVRCDDHVHEADIVLLGIGTEPEVELAAAAGIPLGESGAVAVDDRQHTQVEGIWSAGDCAETVHRVSGRPVNYHLGTIANKQGKIAGYNIGGRDYRFPGVLGTAITKVHDIELARTGLTAAEASDAGFDAVATTFRSTTTANYWPESSDLIMKVVADRASRRLLGTQIVGGPSSGKRIDALAIAIWNEMTVDDLVNVDLSYAPPFSGVWDPVLVAARKALSALDGIDA
jgi:NADPH-dependent 2,4-dienoyl-CoA reductase/sulfur reductase-like enzyme